MSKTCRNTNQVCPPIFNDENECPTYAEDKHVAPGKGSVKSSCFPSDKGVLSEMMKAAKMDMSKMTKADAKGVDGKAVSRRGGAFGRLLSDVTNEQNAEQCERDEKHALDVQCDDALAMASQWMQMDADEKLAQQTQKDQEAENAKALEEKAAAIAIGERAALQVAIQERKNLAAAAQAKLKQEEEDSQHARMSVLQDVEAEHELKTLCEGDADAAKKVYDELQDELFAERLQEQEKKEAALALEKRKAVEYEQALADFEFARQTQISLDVRHAEEQSAQERQDAAMALKFAIVASRQEHRRIKRVQLVQSSSLFNTIQKIGQQWEEAEAQVEDVAGGLCLTLVLPYLRDLKLKASKNNTVDLEAFRIVGKEEHEKGLANDDNSQYCAEFVIDGRNVDISGNDLSFEYSSESGLLHVYIESVHLDTPTDAASSAIGQGNDAMADSKCAGSGAGARAAGAGAGAGRGGSLEHKDSYNSSNSSTSNGTRAGVVSKIASGMKNFFTFSRK